MIYKVGKDFILLIKEAQVSRSLTCKKTIFCILTIGFSLGVSGPMVATYGTFTSLAASPPSGSLYRTLNGSD